MIDGVEFSTSFFINFFIVLKVKSKNYYIFYSTIKKLLARTRSFLFRYKIIKQYWVFKLYLIKYQNVNKNKEALKESLFRLLKLWLIQELINYIIILLALSIFFLIFHFKKSIFFKMKAYHKKWNNFILNLYL